MKMWLTIGALSSATGVPVNTLRTWERRYGFPPSKRKPSGHRLYPPDAIPLVQNARRALALGHRPAETLGLSSQALEAVLSSVRTEPPAAATWPTTALPPSAPASAPGDEARHTGRLLTLAQSFDRDGTESTLRALWTELGPICFLDGFAVPFLGGLEAARRKEQLGLRHERFASNCLASLLRELRRPYDSRAQGPTVVVTMLPGDPGEMGVLMSGLVCAIQGWRVLEFGVGLPSTELGLLVGALPLSAVAVTASPAAPQGYVSALLLELRRTLPEKVALWVGGRRAAPEAPGIFHYDSFDLLDRRLAATAPIPTSG